MKIVHELILESAKFHLLIGILNFYTIIFKSIDIKNCYNGNVLLCILDDSNV